MLDLSKEKDIEVLRTAALLLERENQRLTTTLVELTQRWLLAEGKDKAQLTLRLAEIEQQLAATQKKLYGACKRPSKSAEIGRELALGDSALVGSRSSA